MGRELGGWKKRFALDRQVGEEKQVTMRGIILTIHL